MPLILAFGSQRQVDLCEFVASLVYKSLFQDRHQSYRETLPQKKKKIDKPRHCLDATLNPTF